MKKWLIDVAKRTLKTMAQTAIGVIGSSVVLGDVNWYVVLSSVAMAGITCVLMNLSKINTNEDENKGEK